MRTPVTREQLRRWYALGLLTHVHHDDEGPVAGTTHRGVRLTLRPDVPGLESNDDA